MLLRSLITLALMPGTSAAQQGGSLAESLPADTLFYFEISDIPALRDGFATSAAGRIWNDEEMRSFVGGMVTEAMGQWDQSMSMMAEQGMPVQFMSWDAMQKLEVGFSIASDGLLTSPSMMIAAQITFADGLSEQAFGLISAMMSVEGNAEVSQSATGSVMRIAPGHEGDPALSLEQKGNVLRFTAANMKVDGETLAAAPAFQRGRVQVLQPGMACFGYYNPRKGVEMQRSFLSFGNGGSQFDSMAEAMATFAESAVGNAQAVSFGAGWKDGNSMGSTFVDFGGKPGGWAYAADAADRGMTDYIPSDATSFSIASMGGTEGVAEFFSSFNAVLSDEEMAQNVAIWAEAEPISHSWFVGENRPLLDAALKGFGKRVLAYSSPTRGSRTLIELSDPAAVQAAATPLVKTIAQLLDSVEEMPVALRAKRESPRANPQQTIPVYYLRLKPEALPPEFAQVSMFIGNVEPAFAVSPDGWLVFSMNRADVRSVVRSGLQKEARNIGQNEEAAGFLKRAPQTAVTLAWSDPRPGVTATMGMVQAASGLLGMQMDPSQMPVDLTKMPSANAINRHLRPSESYAWMDELGMKSWSSGSFGMADFLAMAGFVVPTGMMAYMTIVPAMAEAQAWEMAPAPGQPVEVAVSHDPVEHAYADLARLQTGVIIYQLLTEEYPDSLDDLLGEVDGQPLLDTPGDGVPNDPWGNAYIYRQMTNGFMLYSVGPNGQDEGGQGDDVSVEG